MNLFSFLRRVRRCAPICLNSVKSYHSLHSRRLTAIRAAAWRAVEALEQRQLLTVTMASVTPPTGSIVAGAALTFGLSATSDDSSLTGWDIGWGDGSADDTPSASATTVTHTFTSPGVYTISGTAFDDAGSPGYTVTQSLTVSPPPFTVTPPAVFTVPGGSTADVTFGTIAGAAADVADFAGTVNLNGDLYGLSFVTSGSDVLAQVDSLPALSASSSYSAAVSATLTINSVSTDAAAAFTLDTFSGSSTTPTDATQAIPWTGNVATFSDDTSYTDPSDFSAVTTYTGFTAASGGSTISGGVTTGESSFTVSDSETFNVAGSLSDNVAVTDPADRTLDISGSVYVNLGGFSVSANTPSLTEGQAQAGVVLGTLTDTAGSSSVTSDFSASFSTTSYGTYTVTAVPNSPNNGVYNLTADLPALPTAATSGTLYVSETDGSQTLTSSTGVSLDISSCNTLTVSTSDITIEEGEGSDTSIGSIFDSLGMYASPDTYSGTFTLDGTSHLLSMLGGLPAQDFSSLLPGDHTGVLTVTDSGAGSTGTFNIDVTPAPFSVTASGGVSAVLFTPSGFALLGSHRSTATGTITVAVLPAWIVNATMPG